MTQNSIALVAGITSELRLTHYELYNKSVNSLQFIEFIENLIKRLQRKGVVVFLDNLPMHHSRVVKARLEELGV